MAPKEWIEIDETAKEMLTRLLPEHGGRRRNQFTLPPPLHKFPLRSGNVVELVGPSPSAKTHILMQAAISCILPEEWNGVSCGGVGRLVMFVDLDCRFDVLRFSQLLRHHIAQVHCEIFAIYFALDFRILSPLVNLKANVGVWILVDAEVEELFVACMRRFVYVRCFDSLEFLAALKTLQYQIQKEQEALGVGAYLLMIDSIGAFHWVDRASLSLNFGGDKREGLSLQNIWETVVQEIKKVLLVHPMIVITTKAAILGGICSANEVKRTAMRPSSPDTLIPSYTTTNVQQILYREYMPSVWQSFVTHRVFLRTTDYHATFSKHTHPSIFSVEWMLPSLHSVENFVVKDEGIFPLMTSVFADK